MINGAYGYVNEVRGHVVFLNLLVRNIELRKTEGKFENFSNIYLILVPGMRFIGGNEISQNIHRFLWTNLFQIYCDKSKYIIVCHLKNPTVSVYATTSDLSFVK